eukprot:CAMPEP_0202392724 /NCGR_PEP_ID=MMETSP1127-20130417/92532_1 /ASSEMBLY_ACC=CAM_ASM_000462 /TAXON_ID=3047 /ORGANISM="Dunaliella tertiolecta, Strain CCMP1320" /LENGTH=557 /DNA_ID=CAMNT_0048995265 /DNA_START=278 /DNA_END=1952 /DNA_ORIENTATION=-
MAALTSLVEAGSLAACVLCCVQQMHMHAQSVALWQHQYQPVSQEAAGGSREKKPEQLQAASASGAVPSPDWTWQWQQLGSLQASLLTCALLARFVASLLWKVVRQDSTNRSNVTSATASLEMSARVLRMEAMLAKQQQSLDNTTRQADKAALAGRLHRHDIKQPTAQMQATLARHNELLLKLATAQEKLEKQVQDTQLLLGAMQNVSGRQFEVSVQAIQQLKAQQAQLQESLREVKAAAAEARKWAGSGAGTPFQDRTDNSSSNNGGSLGGSSQSSSNQGCSSSQGHSHPRGTAVPWQTLAGDNSGSSSKGSPASSSPSGNGSTAGMTSASGSNAARGSSSGSSGSSGLNGSARLGGMPSGDSTTSCSNRDLMTSSIRESMTSRSASSSSGSSPGNSMKSPGNGSSSSSSSTSRSASSSSGSSPGNSMKSPGNGSSSSSSSSNGSMDDSTSSSGKDHRGSPVSGTTNAWQASDPWSKHPPVAAQGGSSSTGAEDTVDPVETAQRANKQAACVLPHDATPSLSLKASASRPVSPLNMASSCLSFYVPLLQPLFPSCFS